VKDQGRRISGNSPVVCGPVNYEVEIADEATEKLRSMPKEVRRLIGYRVFLLQDNLGGDVQKLRGSKNEYRLRVGNYRVLFELQGNKIMIYAVGDRKEIYR
jgi:mRNA interferase RelE/StbE